MRLHLIRHGDPDYANDSLTALGRKQVAALGKSFKKIELDKIFCSPMGRARMTCAPVAKLKGMEPEILPWLHELNGNYEGSLWAWNQHGCDAFAKNASIGPEDWAGKVAYGKHMEKVSKDFCKSFDAFMAKRGLKRVGALYKAARGFKDAEDIAFFCHAGVTLTLLSHLLHIPLPVCYSQFACEPSSRTTLELELKDGKGIFRLASLNDMSHMRK